MYCDTYFRQRVVAWQKDRCCCMTFSHHHILGVIPAHLNELAPASFRGLMPGNVVRKGINIRYN